MLQAQGGDYQERRKLNLELRRKARKEWFDKLRSKLSCVDCGYDFSKYPECCDFHHRDPSSKRTEVSFLAKNAKNEHLERVVMEEMELCDAVCANCHRIRHAKAYADVV